jgi:DnaJ family protein C protein 28
MKKPPRSLDEQIRQAMLDGAFDNLPGKGKPMDLRENPFEDPDWRMAFRMLRSSGFSLPWMETRKEIEADYELALTQLERSWAWRQSALEDGQSFEGIESEWNRALTVFRNKVSALNNRIFNYNLEVPLDQLKCRLIKLDREIGKITSRSD